LAPNAGPLSLMSSVPFQTYFHVPTVISGIKGLDLNVAEHRF